MKIINHTVLQLLHSNMTIFINSGFERFLQCVHLNLTPESNFSYIPMAFIELQDENELKVIFCEEFYIGAHTEIINVLWGREDIKLFYEIPKVAQLYETWKEYYETHYKV